jgi:hypothetical protein
MSPSPGFDLSDYLGGASLLLAREASGSQGRIATANGDAVDCQECPFELNAVVLTGKIIDGTHTPSIQENTTATAGDGSWAAVAKCGTFTELSVLGDDKVEVVNFKRSKRYVRARMVVATATSGGTYAVIIGAPKQFI